MRRLCLFQVHVHGDLHVRVPDQDPGSGLLCGEVHFPQGSLELARLQCYPHGVSIPLHLTHTVAIGLTVDGLRPAHLSTFAL